MDHGIKSVIEIVSYNPRSVYKQLCFHIVSIIHLFLLLVSFFHLSTTLLPYPNRLIELAVYNEKTRLFSRQYSSEHMRKLVPDFIEM